MAYELLLISLFGLFAYALHCAIKRPYRFRMTFVMVGLSLFVLLWLPVMCLRPRDYRNGLAPAWAYRQLCRLVGITAEVRGHEHVQQNKGSVVLMNHQSIVDLIILAELWPIIGRATVVARREILFVPFFGIGAWLWGTLFINRTNRQAAIASLAKQTEAINVDNCKILVFPEGKRHGGDTFLPFKKGPFHLAMDSKCTLQPVVASQYHFTDEKSNSFRAGHIIIKILPVIDAKDFEDLSALSEHCRTTMLDEYKLLNAEQTKKAL